ncbi:MAG: transketolase, partial [bacterium]
MRNAFAGDITKYAFYDDDIMILSGDVGNKLFNPYKKLQPDQFMNCGVAEANMTSMAGGMAMSGMRPFTYSITPFNTTRCI